jgi:hypothetical protein
VSAIRSPKHRDAQRSAKKQPESALFPAPKPAKFGPEEHFTTVTAKMGTDQSMQPPQGVEMLLGF